MENRTVSEIDLVQGIEAIPAIMDVVCRITGMGFAAIARVTDDRWIACSVRDEIDFGLRAGDELPVETTLCHDVKQLRKPIVVDDVGQSPEFRDHLPPARYSFKSYISVPITLADGAVFGTLCAMDLQSRTLNRPEIVEMFRLFAELIGFHIDAVRRLNASETRLGVSETKLGISEAKLGISQSRLEVSEASLLDERATAELREQFIAVLGHDLRNPLSAISGAASLIARTPLNERAAKLIGALQSSVVRMTGLIDNVLDFARGRLGSGLTLSPDLETGIEATLCQAVDELRIIAPDREIVAAFDVRSPVECDRARIAQLFSNLLGNALTHGAADAPIDVRASTSASEFVLSVANAGAPIPQAALERLFQPFYRGAVRPSQQGLGLGLFIASEIARAHRGALTVTSDVGETRFTLRMPLRQDERADLERAPMAQGPAGR